METAKTKKAVTFTRIEEISRDELVDLFFGLELKGANFVQVLTKTVPQMRKTANPFFGDIHKVSDTNCQIGWWYENAVNNRRQKEGNESVFSQKERKWGKHMINPINGQISKVMIDHTKANGEYKQYVQLRTLSVKSTEYKHNSTNQPLTASEYNVLQDHLSKRQKSKTQDVEKDIIVSDYSIDNILQITINQVRYIVR